MHRPLSGNDSDPTPMSASSVGSLARSEGDETPLGKTPLNAGKAAQRRAAIGPDGRPVRMEDLPPANTKRWVMRRKAIVVAGVRAGLITLEQACDRYNLSTEEFQSWQRLIERHGVRGLRTTRLQQYRSRETGHASAP